MGAIDRAFGVNLSGLKKQMDNLIKGVVSKFVKVYRPPSKAEIERLKRQKEEFEAKRNQDREKEERERARRKEEAEKEVEDQIAEKEKEVEDANADSSVKYLD